MEHPHEPIKAIQSWQEWYKKNRSIAQIDTPLATKDSRENLHNSFKGSDRLPDLLSEGSDRLPDLLSEGSDRLPDLQTPVLSTNKQKAVDYFADTLAEFSGLLTGAELFESFLTAAVNSLEVVQKEYEQAKDLVDLLRYKTYLNKPNKD